ncbi:MAG: hypothetical protein R3F30_15650 [Planctomycetota bacterium]
MRRPARSLCALALCGLVACADPVGDGFAAFDAGRFDEARDAFARAEAARGDDAGPALLYDRALAALLAGRLREAEWSAEKLAVRGGVELRPLRDHLLGHAAWRSAALARAEAALLEADPTALKQAVVSGRRAVAAFRRAVVARPAWVAARRDLERAQRGLVELEAQGAEAERKRRQLDPEKPEEERKPEGDGQQEEVRPDLQQAPSELGPDEVERIFALLDGKEHEKRELRRSRRQELGRSVDKDW